MAGGDVKGEPREVGKKSPHLTLEKLWKSNATRSISAALVPIVAVEYTTSEVNARPAMKRALSISDRPFMPSSRRRISSIRLS